MKTQIYSKIAAIGAAMAINTAMIGGVAFLFSGQIHQEKMVGFARSAPVSTVTQAV